MISFNFKVNKTFLEGNHPITIPKSVEQSVIKEIYCGTAKRNLKVDILTQSGRKLEGHIYYGCRTNDYYQLRVLGDYPSDYFGHLKLNKIINISIERTGEKVLVRVNELTADDIISGMSPEKIKKILNKLLND